MKGVIIAYWHYCSDVTLVATMCSFITFKSVIYTNNIQKLNAHLTEKTPHLHYKELNGGVQRSIDCSAKYLFSAIRLDRFLESPSHLFDGYWGFSPQDKATGTWSWLLTPIHWWGYEWVERYLCAAYTPSWRVQAHHNLYFMNHNTQTHCGSSVELYVNQMAHIVTTTSKWLRCVKTTN
jgi:hypothetical protein